MTLFKEKISLSTLSLVLALYTVIAFHLPFFRHLVQCTSGGFNGVVLTVSAFLLLLGLDFLLYYLLVFLGRIAGKCVVAFTLFADAVSLYCINDYKALITDEIMGCVLNTQYSEVSGFLSFSLFLYILFLAVPPIVYLFARKVDYGGWKRFGASLGISVAVLLAVVFGNMKNWPWIDRNSTELGSLTLPWAYTVNTFRYLDAQKRMQQEEILLPDATAVSGSRDVCVLIIGESARRDHFSYYGYPKPTNPYTSLDNVTAYPAVSSATYTQAGVKALLEAEETRDLYEILPNYLHRMGVDVSWRTSNWGEPPTHFEKYYHVADLKARFPEADEHFDGILLAGLKEDILASDKDKVFVVLHTYTNHGPSYNTNYPKEFEVFTPVSSTVEMAKVKPEELLNAYDNSIVYTDWLIHSVIQTLREIPDRRGCVLFVSDHGESLGENDLYMHGVPMAIAPREQIEIPFLAWTSAPGMRYKSLKEVGQHHVFHSVLRFLGIDSPAFDESLCIFEPEPHNHE